MTDRVLLYSRHCWVACVLLLATAAGIYAIASRGTPVVVATNLEKLPMVLGGHQGRTDSFSQGVYDALNADLHLYRHYKDVHNQVLSLYIGYYGTAKGGRTGHNPYACLPGAGWGITETKQIRVFPSYYPQGVDINYVLAQRNDALFVLMHWYQSDGQKILANGLEQNLQRFKGRLLHNRNDGAYIQVTTSSTKQDLQRDQDRLKAFIETLLEQIPPHWPVEN